MNLYKTIENMLNDGKPYISMHVPGHKNNTIGYLSMIDARFDMTEIDGLDDLHEPEGILKKINQNLSQKYPGYIAQMMVNGTTNGMISAIFALKNKTVRFVIVDHAHKSVYHGMQLTGADYIEAASAELFDLQINAGDTIILTYPTYTGDTIDVQAIIAYAHRHNARVITDEAHGAHFDIVPGFPESSMKHDSDITIQSYHKMLPALTMASVIFTKSQPLHDEVMKYINYFETSSPSYLVMLSIESAHEFYKTYHPESFFENRSVIIEALRKQKLTVEKKADPAKILLSHPELSSYKLAKILAEQHHIHHEMVTDEGVLWCLPLFHRGDRYPLETLIHRIGDITRDSGIPMQSVQNIESKETARLLSDVRVLLNNVCRRNIVPYPPGIPLVREGEVITEEHIKTITHNMYNRVRIEGVKHNLEHYKNEES
ncbi:hypothetical protein [Salinicoccus sp. HZC-1]|uniref:hypothetical protein n=1 Tax=Salinicoccus sp. HZC-1 TaxID=3385497 RepID=UPI00398A7C78